jgi:hypothetical protein
MDDEQPSMNGNRTADGRRDQTEQQHAKPRKGSLGGRCGACIGCILRGLNSLVACLRKLGLGVVKLLGGLVVTNLSLRRDDGGALVGIRGS